MFGENSNPYRFTKTVDQIIEERTNAKRNAENARIKAAADKQAAAIRAKKLKQISAVTTELDRLRFFEVSLEKQITVAEATLKAAVGGDAIDAAIVVINDLRKRIADVKTRKVNSINELKSLVHEIDEKRTSQINISIQESGLTKPDANKKQKKVKPATEDTPEPPAPQPFTGYVYNLPMIQSAYFRQNSPQGQSTTRGVTGAGNYTDARNMFGESIAKGTIQMPLNLTNSAAWKFKTGIYKEDSTMYGFKFLYNPTEVNMGWGMLEGVDPNVIRSGAAGGLAPISGVGLSTIDFTLLLNRIGDMDFLDEEGRLELGATNPYPGINTLVRQEDLKTIYKKGTMYDLEYLFRVINGPNAIHQTILNGKSADWGFLIGSQIELFLGDGLRYLVRLNGINVSHTIFNDRMVPVLSQVSLSCGRYNDVGLKPEDNR